MTFFVAFAGLSPAERRYKERGRSNTGSRLSSEAPPGPDARTASNRAAGPSDATQGLDANVASQHVALPSATADTATDAPRPGARRSLKRGRGGRAPPAPTSRKTRSDDCRIVDAPPSPTATPAPSTAPSPLLPSAAAPAAEAPPEKKARGGPKSGSGAAAGFASQEDFNPPWHAIYGFPSELRSEEEVTELLRKEPAFVARVVASTFDFFGPGPELCRKVALQLAAESAVPPPPTPTVPRPPSPSPTVIPPPEGGYTHAAVDRFDWPRSPTRAPAALSVPPSVAKKSAIAKRMAPAGASSSTGAAMQSAMAELCVSDMTPEEARRITKSEAAKMLLQRAGVRHQVAPNGTCWLYAALAALRVLEHASTTSPLPEPTLRDIRSSEVVLKAMKKHFLTVPVPRKPGRAQKNASNYDDYWRVSDVLSRQNVWVRSMGDNPAEYGSEPMLTLLARTLDRTIIVLDGPTMANVRDSVSAEETGLTGEDKKHHIHEPQSQKLYRKTLNTIGVLIHLESDQDTLVLEHVNGDHYVGLALTGVAPAKLPACLSAANAALACENR